MRHRRLLALVALVLIAAAPAWGGRRCRSRSDCPANQVCISPEEEAAQACGHDMQRDTPCPAGTVADHCGGCIPSCASDRDCPKGKSCNGLFCVSPPHCQVPKPKRP